MDEKQENLISQYMTSKNKQIYYCKECGCIIDNDGIYTDNDCIADSKNKQVKILNILLIILSLFLVVSIHKIYTLNQNLQQTESILQTKDAQIDELNSQLSEAHEQNAFFNEHCAIVLDGRKIYHTYDCYFFQNSKNKFYVMTIEQAEDAGYRPCKKCHNTNNE
jgi:hypothetical protein